MLTKRIFHVSINCRKFIFAPRLKPTSSICQVKDFSDHINLLPKVENETRKTQNKFSEFKSSSIVLDLLKLNFNEHNLSSSDTIQALTKLVQLCKQENLRPQEVVHEDFFKNLCVLINSQTNNLNLSEAMQILDLFRSLRVRSSAKTTEYLLERVDKLLSTASFSDYNRIMKVVIRMPSFATAQAIKNRLIKKFIFKISADCDKKEPDFIVEAFRFACLYTNDQKILKIILETLDKNDLDRQPLGNILSLMITLSSSFYYSRICDEILEKVQNAFIKNISQINNEDILFVLRNCSKQIKKNREQFYKKTLFDEAIRKLTSSECNLKEGIQCLQITIDVKHTSKELLNYLSSEIYASKEIDRKVVDDPILFRMLEGLAHLKHRPFCWDMFVENFITSKMLKYKTETLLYVAYHLACLDHYRPKVLGKVFEHNFDFKENRIVHYTYLKLYQKLKTTPDYNGPLPSVKHVESFENLMREIIDYPLYTSLTEGLGGSQYLKSNIRTKLYHQIDHIIAYQPGGSPLAIETIQTKEDGNTSGSIEYLENFNFPENSQIVAVMFTPWFWYARNTNEMLGKFSTYFESLETFPCRVVTVCDRVWLSLPKASRTAFLMNLIKAKLESNER